MDLEHRLAGRWAVYYETAVLFLDEAEVSQGKVFFRRYMLKHFGTRCPGFYFKWFMCVCVCARAFCFEVWWAHNNPKSILGSLGLKAAGSFHCSARASRRF